jgi:hypothetical protein
MPTTTIPNASCRRRKIALRPLMAKEEPDLSVSREKPILLEAALRIESSSETVLCGKLATQVVDGWLSQAEEIEKGLREKGQKM